MDSLSTDGLGTGLPPRRWRRRIASLEAAAIAGIICAAGWSIGIRGLLLTPSVDATPEEITAFYADPSAGPNVLLLLQVIVIATIAFLWFIGVVRGRLGDAEPKLFGTVFLAGAIMLAVLILVGTGMLAAPSVLLEVGGLPPDPGAVSMTRGLAVTMLAVYAPRVATLVVFSTAALGRATGALPKWLVWVSYAVGLFEFFNVALILPTFYIIPAWIALVSIVLLVRRSPSAAAAS